MCYTILFEERLGRRREGWAVYMSKTQEVTWLSDKQIKSKLAAGERVNGVTVTESGEVQQDDAFTTGGLLSKTGLATFSLIREDEDSGVSKYFAVTKVIKGGKSGDRYELVSNRFKLEVVDENRLKALLSLISVGGARIGSGGKIEIHEGVEISEATGGSSGAREGAV